MWIGPNPVTTSHGVKLGDGTVVPEFTPTLPLMEITERTRSRVVSHYRQIVADVELSSDWSTGRSRGFEASPLELLQAPPTATDSGGKASSQK